MNTTPKRIPSQSSAQRQRTYHSPKQKCQLESIVKRNPIENEINKDFHNRKDGKDDLAKEKSWKTREKHSVSLPFVQLNNRRAARDSLFANQRSLTQ